MAQDPEVDSLWRDFHQVVNMTSRELRDFLMTDSAGERSEPLPEEIDDSTGWQVLEILGKRKGDLTEEDALVMRQVLDIVRDVRGDEEDATADALMQVDPDLRHQLMSVGHDPLRPPELRDPHGRGA